MMTDFKGTTLESEGWEPTNWRIPPNTPLSILRDFYVNEGVVYDPRIHNVRCRSGLYPPSKGMVRIKHKKGMMDKVDWSFTAGPYLTSYDEAMVLAQRMIVIDNPPTFRDEVTQILQDISLDEWTHSALDKIEDALVRTEKGEE